MHHLYIKDFIEYRNSEACVQTLAVKIKILKIATCASLIGLQSSAFCTHL